MKVVLFVGLASALFLAGCGHSAVPSTAPQTMGDLGSSSTSSTQVRQIADTDREPENVDDDNGSVLKTLDDMRTIGSTVDPVNGAQNPYGLDIAKTTSGNIRRGDLVVCNFNDAANVQGTGFSLIALHPQQGSNPLSISRSKELTGCTALAMSPLGPAWAASFAENENPIISGTGVVLNDLHNGPFNGPFGQAFAPHQTFGAVASFYESNAGDGSLVRINISPQRMFSFDVIAHGFPVNHGAPGGILGPSGLQYDKKHDRLFIVDGTNNTVYALRHVSTIPANGIVVNGTQFSGPFARRARVVFSGAPLNGPISSALLFNDNLVIGNTLDPDGQNLMVEVTPHGRLLDVKNVDTGTAGALFGMVASGDGRGDTKLYFNDDNENTVKLLTR